MKLGIGKAARPEVIQRVWKDGDAVGEGEEVSRLGKKNQSRIINPAGEVLAETADAPAFVVQAIDLNREWRVRWLSLAQGDGEARSLYIQERRPDTYSTFTEDTNRRSR